MSDVPKPIEPETTRLVEYKCIHCNQNVSEHRVYFGIVGPFCNVDCREAYLEIDRQEKQRERHKADLADHNADRCVRCGKPCGAWNLIPAATGGFATICDVCVDALPSI